MACAPGQLDPLYQEEVKCMMYVGGEMQDPSDKTVRIMERLVQDQVQKLLDEIRADAIAKQKKVIGIKDVVGFFSHDRARQLRLKSALEGKWSRNPKRFNHLAKPFRPKNLGLEPSPLDEAAREFNLQRLRVKDVKTDQMSLDEYKRYVVCSHASFTRILGNGYPDCSERFIQWTGLPEAWYTDLDDVLDALSLIAFEMVVALTEEAMKLQSQTAPSAGARRAKPIEVEHVVQASRQLNGKKQGRRKSLFLI